jgi:type I pantothenate kinase
VVTIGSADIVIVEGLNVLQSRTDPEAPATFVSDYFDFSIYVDADPRTSSEWYLERFMTLQRTAFATAARVLPPLRTCPRPRRARSPARIWETTSTWNLRENILPTRERANLILEKATDHSVRRVRLRKRCW